MKSPKILLFSVDISDMSTDILDLVSSTYGAIVDRDDCRKLMVCSTCTAISHAVPSTKIAMLVGDHLVPREYKNDMYFVAKSAFINDNQEHCHEVYRCSTNVEKADNEL